MLRAAFLVSFPPLCGDTGPLAPSFFLFVQTLRRRRRRRMIEYIDQSLSLVFSPPFFFYGFVLLAKRRFFFPGYRLRGRPLSGDEMMTPLFFFSGNGRPHWPRFLSFVLAAGRSNGSSLAGFFLDSMNRLFPPSVHRTEQRSGGGARSAFFFFFFFCPGLGVRPFPSLSQCRL